MIGKTLLPIKSVWTIIKSIDWLAVYKLKNKREKIAP